MDAKARQGAHRARLGFALALLVGLAAPAAAEPEAVVITPVDFTPAATAPAYVNGAGPFRFVVDTGSNSSALSRRIADSLGLVPHGRQLVHGATGTFLADLATVREIRSGALTLTNQTVLVYDYDRIDGVLGVDGLQDKRLEFDMERGEVRIGPSRAQPPPGWVSIQARPWSGPIVVIDGSLSGVRGKIKVMLDTGATITVGNLALRGLVVEEQQAINVIAAQIRLSGIDGNATTFDRAPLPPIRLGELTVKGTMGVFADFDAFRLWGLADTPALLIGMDVLGHAKGLAVDYKRKDVQLRQ